MNTAQEVAFYLTGWQLEVEANMEKQRIIDLLRITTRQQSERIRELEQQVAGLTEALADGVDDAVVMLPPYPANDTE